MRRRQILAAGSAAIGAFSLAGPAHAIGCNIRCSSRVDRRSRMMLKQALTKGFGIQYWGSEYSASDLALAPHGLLILEASRVGAYGAEDEVLFDPDEVSEIRKGGTRPAIGYLNLTEIETYRDYWRNVGVASAEPEVLLSDYPWMGPLSSNGERLAAFWAPEWEMMLKKRIDNILAAGFDGIFLDDVLHYFTFLSEGSLSLEEGAFSPPKKVDYATAMMQLIIRLSDYIRLVRPDAIIVANNGVFLAGDAGDEIGVTCAEALFVRYRGALDGILIESAFGSGATDQTQATLKNRYLENGVSVLTVDFASQLVGPSDVAIRMSLELQAQLAGFVPYLADNDAFDRLYLPTAQ